MARKTFEIAFELAGKINSSFSGVFASASDRLRQLNQHTASLKTELMGLERAQKQTKKEIENSVKAYSTLKNSYSQSLQTLLQLNQKITSIKTSLKALSNEKKAGTITTEEFSAKQAELVAQLKKANEAYTALKSKVQSIKSEMQRLSEVEQQGKLRVEQNAKAYDELAKKLEKAERAQQRLAKAVNLQNKVDEFRGRMRGGLLDAAGMAATVGTPVYAAMQFESSMADVRKVVDFETPQQFKAMEKDILNLSKRIPMAAEGLAQIVAAGGQAGIAREELLGYAEAAAKMGVAFDISAEEAGQTMAQWRSAFKMTQEQVNTLADQINYLGNTTAASAPKISEVVRRIGPLGEVGGAAAAEIAALGATMVSAGITEEVAATGIKNLILGLTAGEAATKSQAAAFAQLGLDAAEMAKLMQKDAQGAILRVLEALQKLPEYKRAAVLSDLFGKESIGAISPLLTNLEALEDNFKKVGDATQYAGSMEKEFEARSSTTANSLQLLRNRAVAIGIAIGDIMLPWVTEISNKLSAAADWVQKFTEKHPGLTRVIVLGTSAVLGLSVVLAGLGYVLSILITSFVNFYVWAKKVELASKLNTAATKAWEAAQWLWNTAMRAGQGLLSVGRLVLYHAKTLAVSIATKAWTAAQWLLNAALSANPIGLVVIAVAGLAAGLLILYHRSEKVRTAVDAFWKGLKSGAVAAINFVIDKINALIDKINIFIDLLNKIKIPDWVPIIGGKGLSIPKIERISRISTGEKIPGHAEGGIFSRPHLALVAEAGPEAVIPLDGSPRSLGLLARAGELLGVRPVGGANITYAPVYNIYGGSNVEAQVRRAAKAAEDDFAARFKAYLHQERRLSYA